MPNKVLYVGNYKDGTGWSQAAIHYMTALMAAGIEVVPREFKYDDKQTQPPPAYILDAERKCAKDCNIIIQNIWPEHMQYDGHFDKNIGIYYSETSNLLRSGWSHYLNLLDELWVPNKQMIVAARASGVTVPMYVVPIPCDVDKYCRSYERFSIDEIKDTFTFYTIGELNRRKNIVALLKAFHLEFNLQEYVSLVIKCSSNTEQYINMTIQRLKSELKLYSSLNLYNQEIVITEDMTNEDIMRLHATCDCGVFPSFGEAWCLPAFDATGMGNAPICTNVGGMAEFLTTEDGDVAGWLIDSYETPVVGMKDGFPDNLFTGRETWQEISIPKLRMAMREAFENKYILSHKSVLGGDRVYDYSYEIIGNQMKNLLQ